MQLNDTLSHQAPPAALAGGGFRSIEAVLHNSSLDVQQKRAILSSWASDLFAVESCPWLREVPGVPTRLKVSDIFAALRSLDGDSPPPGGATVRAFPQQRGVRVVGWRRTPRLAIA